MCISDKTEIYPFVHISYNYILLLNNYYSQQLLLLLLFFHRRSEVYKENPGIKSSKAC